MAFDHRVYARGRAIGRRLLGVALEFNVSLRPDVAAQCKEKEPAFGGLLGISPDNIDSARPPFHNHKLPQSRTSGRTGHQGRTAWRLLRQRKSALRRAARKQSRISSARRWMT